MGEEEGALLSEEEAWADDSVDEDALEDAPIAMQVGCYLTSINKKRLAKLPFFSEHTSYIHQE